MNDHVSMTRTLGGANLWMAMPSWIRSDSWTRARTNRPGARSRVSSRTTADRSSPTVPSGTSNRPTASDVAARQVRASPWKRASFSGRTRSRPTRPRPVTGTKLRPFWRYPQGITTAVQTPPVDRFRRPSPATIRTGSPTESSVAVDPAIAGFRRCQARNRPLLRVPVEVLARVVTYRTLNPYLREFRSIPNTAVLAARRASLRPSRSACDRSRWNQKWLAICHCHLRDLNGTIPSTPRSGKATAVENPPLRKARARRTSSSKVKRKSFPARRCPTRTLLTGDRLRRAGICSANARTSSVGTWNCRRSSSESSTRSSRSGSGFDQRHCCSVTVQVSVWGGPGI